MSRRSRIIVAGAGAPGVVLQSIGLVWIVAADAESGLLAGGALFVAGTIPLTWALEYCAARKGRRGAWALFSLLGPPGLIAVALLREGDVAAPCAAAELRGERPLPDRVAGAVATALVTAGFIWAAMQCVAWNGREDKPDRGEVVRNERLALKRLRLITGAQERYREADRYRDGEKTYALFLVHLWRTVDREGRAVPVDLIPRRLAFAMGPTRAVDGYYYVDLRVRELPPGASSDDERMEELYGTATVEELDPAKEWAMTARPAVHDVSGVLTFIADASGRIFARDLRGAWQTRYPHDPAREGWTELARADALDSLQETVARSAR